MGSSVGRQCRRIAILTDVHANLLALEAALSAIAGLDCDEIVHTGDAIGIGPFPAETLDGLLTLPRIRFLMGNHDAWFANGLPAPRPGWMSAGEEAHHAWVHAQLDRFDPRFREMVAAWPWALDDEIEGVRMRFQHYGLAAGQDEFVPIVAGPTGGDLDRVFAISTQPGPVPDVVFYGHHHPQSDLAGFSGIRYINPGALGCSYEPLARFSILRVAAHGDWDVTHHTTPYDLDEVMHAYDERDVPERDLIRTAFFGR